MDGYCKAHYPPNVQAKIKERDDKWAARWAAERKERAESEAMRKHSEHCVSCHDDLMFLVKWMVDHPGECLGDHGNIERQAHEILAKAETSSEESAISSKANGCEPPAETKTDSAA
jgi:hypothetical protein